MKKLIFFLFLLSLSFASTCADITTAFDDAWIEASSYFGVVILFTVAMITLAYVYGKSSNDAKALVFSKDELFHLFISIAIIFATVGVITTFCFIGQAFLDFSFGSLGIADSCYPSSTTPSEMAICYTKLMESDAKDMVSIAIESAIQYEMDSTWVFTNNFPLMGSRSVPTKAYLKSYGSTFDILNNMFATPSLISIAMQKIFLQSSLKFSIVFLFPMAILLRVFFPTRQMGNALIAVVIGIHVFLPLMYALNGAMYSYIFTENICITNPDYSAALTDHVLGDCDSETSFLKFARMIPQAIFLPNLTIAIFITFLSSINKALRVIG